MSVISKPNKTTYTNALEHAERVRETGDDPYQLAHTILYLAERNQMLEAVFKASEAYIRFGEDQQLHTNLLKALQNFEDYETEAEKLEDPKFGLN